jgi:hypothetical protein
MLSQRAEGRNGEQPGEPAHGGHAAPDFREGGSTGDNAAIRPPNMDTRKCCRAGGRPPAA